MGGFFTAEELRSKTRPSGKSTFSCISCGLSNCVQMPKPKPYGNFDKQILIIGETPTEHDDDTNSIWSDKPGRFLRRTLQKNNIDLEQDCLSIFAIQCSLYKSTTNVLDEQRVLACRSFVLQTIESYKPKLVLILGSMALQSVIGYRWKEDLGGLQRWRGFVIPDSIFKCWLAPIFSPEYVIANEDKPDYMTIWYQDIKNALSKLHKKPKFFPKAESQVEIIKGNGITDILEETINAARKTDIYFAFDYETTGLKPHNTEIHKIVSMSFCIDGKKAFAFEMPKKGTQALESIKNVLTDTNIYKIMHNMKFEITWSKVFLNINVSPVCWDPMLAAHVLDNRQRISGLKFQTYINFGEAGYDQTIAPYLKANNKDGNSVNKINEVLQTPAQRTELLLYNGLDSFYTWHLAMVQMGALNAWEE